MQTITSKEKKKPEYVKVRTLSSNITEQMDHLIAHDTAAGLTALYWNCVYLVIRVQLSYLPLKLPDKIQKKE
jgi:hypothetical protein